MSMHIRAAALAACLLSLAVTARAQDDTRSVPVALTIASANATPGSIGSAEPGAFAQATQRSDQETKLKGYSVVLLSGETPGVPTVGEPSGEIPPAVQKALSNVQAFLPYKTYRLYDASLLRPPSVNSSATVFMRGENATRLQVLLVVMASRPQPGSTVVTLSISEVGPLSASANGNESANRRTIMSAGGLSISPGETIVVGTSRTGGGRALIALLTAIPE